MSASNARFSHEDQNGSPSNGNQMPDHISSEILEHGNIFFFYRPKVGAREVTGVDDIRRFFMATATDSRILLQKWKQRRMLELNKKHNVQYRTGEQAIRRSLVITHLHGLGSTIGKKSLPGVRGIQRPEGWNGIGQRLEEYSMVRRI